LPQKRDYYEVLGVSREARDSEIKSAYRQLAIKYHPDRNSGDAEAEEHFKEAAEAYAVLSDRDKRSRYDRFGHQASAGGGFGGFDAETFGDFSDILGDLFGFGSRRRQRRGGPQPGADLRYDLGLSFLDSAFGSEITLRIPRLETCDTCRGSGSADGSAPQPCNSCGGRGQVRVTQGFFTVARTCPTCGGQGSVVTSPCADCDGEGRREKEHSLQLTIPPGVDTGSRLRLAGEGEHGVRGGPPGDLYVVIHSEEHETFHRDGFDVLSEVKISYPLAVLGGKVEIETIHGIERLSVPSGAQHGQTLTLRGKGVPRLGRSGHGDHRAVLRLIVPKARDLDGEQLELIEALARRGKDHVHEERNVLDRVKDLFA
jgi:molecular chaperone DnaJ